MRKNLIKTNCSRSLWIRVNKILAIDFTVAQRFLASFLLLIQLRCLFVSRSVTSSDGAHSFLEPGKHEKLTATNRNDVIAFHLTTQEN